MNVMKRVPFSYPLNYYFPHGKPANYRHDRLSYSLIRLHCLKDPWIVPVSVDF